MKKRSAFDPRALMEQAVEVMRHSIEEPRKDGKVCPRVGAVLWKENGTVETAYRSELRDGDHAEFTLLERKNRSSRLDGAVLFATLEPCAPDARRSPKMGCAERIALTRIKEVWVGIEDPDPTVDRKGIKYLQEAGITVHMFDRDLQEKIREENAEFIAQALERAEAAEEAKSKEVILSPLEESLENADYSDLSLEALEQYRLSAKIEANVGSVPFNRLLVRQGLLKQGNGEISPTGFGLLLFGKEPRASMPQAGLLATIYYPNGEQEIENFEGPMVLIPESVEKWLSDKLPHVIDRSAMRRRTAPPLPFEMVREGVVNALIHRDYDIVRAKSHLVVTSDTITIKSPGMPVEPITLEQMQSFSAPMLSRNPALHYVFARMEMAEERGLGLRSLRDEAQKLDLPRPKYSWDNPYLVLTLYRHPGAVQTELPQAVISELKGDELAVLDLVIAGDTIAARDVMKALDVDERKAQRVLRKLIEVGLIQRVGRGPATRYEAIR